ncbi:tyrosine-type recombinase/integrase, partial [Arthrobacter sp. H14]|uniref:tyrosine-type recombinase/integrase n=1 Tax=Arthrobacter sp. H14 TaxID=1312959 RepID=UPI00056A670E
GQRSVGTIRHTEVQTWVSNLAKEKSPTTVNRVHGVLASILDGAVQDKRIAKNPARDIKLPTKRKAKKIYLTHLQVDRLSKASKYPDFILFIAYSGLRWGEATGLRVGDVDRTRRRAQIEENAVNVNGRIQIGTPKSNERRSIVYPAFLNDAIKRACENKRPEDLLWPSIEGKHLRSGNMDSGWFIGAVKRVRAADEAAAAVAEKNGEEAPPIMPRVTPHDLRHTAASLAISAGANVKALQRMLGHASAAMTLDRYADLFEDDLDSVAEALDRHRTLSLMTTP